MTGRVDSISRAEWEWFGRPGHLIVSRDCRYHLCTAVGPWLVSTVGEWLPDSSSWDIYAERAGGIPPDLRGDEKRNWFLLHVGFVEIGAGRKYETMVFRTTGKRCEDAECGCGLPEVSEWSELDFDGYNRQGDARRGHYAMCEKWASRPEGSPAAWEDE
jgi:hypothetical protein